jgi:hypothetical protein
MTKREKLVKARNAANKALDDADKARDEADKARVDAKKALRTYDLKHPKKEQK